MCVSVVYIQHVYRMCCTYCTYTTFILYIFYVYSTIHILCISYKSYTYNMYIYWERWRDTAAPRSYSAFGKVWWGAGFFAVLCLWVAWMIFVNYTCAPMYSPVHCATHHRANFMISSGWGAPVGCLVLCSSLLWDFIILIPVGSNFDKFGCLLVAFWIPFGPREALRLI